MSRNPLMVLVLICDTAFGLAVTQSVAAETAGARLALLITNARYPSAANPSGRLINDAATQSEELRQVGLATAPQQNLSNRPQDIINDVEAKIRPGSVALLFVAGVGMEVDRPSTSVPEFALLAALASSPGAGASASAAPRPGELFRDCADCGEMVVVPAGEFQMGGNDTPYEKPVHRVTIASPFAIGRREVTFSEWEECVAAAACRYLPDDHGFGRGDHPVIDISWDDAKTFVSWMSQKTGKTYRLPTEAEWEYAARAGTTSTFWWGRETGSGRANCQDCGPGMGQQTLPVGSFRPNGFGLYDTAGNAAEWVEDCWNDSFRGAPHDGSAWTSGNCGLRVLRGGSFANKATSLRSAHRFRYDEDVRYYGNGFRVARDVP
jgi:formylglycine-generating enzyme required for sulfatase activity